MFSQYWEYLATFILKLKQYFIKLSFKSEAMKSRQKSSIVKMIKIVMTNQHSYVIVIFGIHYIIYICFIWQ